MPSAFQLKTKPEIQNQMLSTLLTQLEEIDENIGSIIRSLVEAASLSDAEQYVMIGKLVTLFDRLRCKGQDLDRRALEYGANVFKDMLRRQASQSDAKVIVGDGTLQKSSFVSSDVLATVTSFDIASGTGWPVSGAAVIGRGTIREETIVFTIAGDTLTVVSPAGGLVNPHIAGEVVETIATKSVLAAGISVGAASCSLQAGTEGAWPASGSVILERDTVRREIRTFTRVGAVLTFGAVTTFAHGIGTSATLSTFGSDRAVNSGSVAYVPADATSVKIVFRTTAAGTLLDGDYVTTLIDAKSDGVGADTMVGSGTITSWQTAPFTGATVTNPDATVGGRDQERDDEYNARISAFIQSLSRATALAIETLVAGKEDPFTEKTIAFAQTVEPVAPGASQLYVTDGSPTFAVDFQVFSGRDVLIADARTNDARARLHQYAPFQVVANPNTSRTPRIFKSSERGVATLVGVLFLEDNTKTWTINQWAGYKLKTDDNQFYAIVSNTAIRLIVTASASGSTTPSNGSYSITNFAVDPLVPGTDYTFNESNGDLELVVPLVQHDSLVAADDGASPGVGAYTYSRGVGAYAQRLVNGDRTALDDFPGIKALGTKCLVIAPTVISPTFTIQVVTQSGFADADLVTTVQSVVESYVNSLGIGEQILISEIIRRVKALTGVADCKVLSPTSNVTVAAGQLARINAINVTVV